ncbi:MAG: metal ABC transporter substrate-binding protein [Termitinemataceae bacterium]|nr:MAG: metal ABC transporter substrate-binding protein [Termitinemataceae bacterium]
MKNKTVNARIKSIFRRYSPPLQTFGFTLPPLLFICLLLLSFTSCRQKDKVVQLQNNLFQVTTTIFPAYDFTRLIAKDKVHITMLIPPGAESHSFEPSPKDMIHLQKTDIFIYTGGESDTFVKDILSSTDTSKMRIISLMENVNVVEEELVEGMEDEAEAEESETEIAYDEHVWTSPENAALIVQTISKTLCDADPVNADFYITNTVAYLAELQVIDAEYKEVVDNAKRKTIIFADRFPFRYLADAYGLKYFAAFPGCSTETEPSAATVAFLVNKVRAEKIPVVFYLELSNQRMADTICEETGAKKLMLHAAHNVTKKDFDGGITYLDIQKQNIKNLKEALN